MSEERWVAMETKIAYQEDMVEELNKVVYAQQKKIDYLEAVCNSLIDHVRSLSDAVAEGKGVSNEKPPHY